MRALLSISIITVALLARVVFANEPLYAVSLSATPVFNTPEISSVFGGKNGKTLQTDSCGQLRALEFVALPGTLFTVEKVISVGGRKVYRVTTTDYPYTAKNGYYIDSDFVEFHRDSPHERPKHLPLLEMILTRLKAANNSRYVWGGNVAKGLPEMLNRHPAARSLSLAEQKAWTLHGVDCSGLLYEATGGFTPRNTSSLVSYGSGVKIAGKSPKEIAAALKPLDLIVWPGHVMIVIDEGKVIESRLVCNNPENGVRIRDIREALAETMKRRTPSDRISSGSGEFVVRRWYQNQE
ncbi:MAG: C40 family peptidase [Geobacteraceae bacterium]|nr:C40 family peptidase [Geobacteraceae bacterium]